MTEHPAAHDKRCRRSPYDPPVPTGVDENTWRDAIRAERLRIDASLMQIGVKERSRFAATNDEYLALRTQVGEALFYQANKALIEWEKQQKASCEARHMRLPSSDWRAWPRVVRPALAHRRVQHPVGQGGFHAGIVREYGDDKLATFCEAGLPSVLYVYDCGSDRRKYIDREVKSLVAKRAGQFLDFLFLSHFDRDHMCGIPGLLSETGGLKADTIVLPYVDGVERLLAFGRSAQTRGSNEANRFFGNMVVDPVATLQQFSPRQIVFVTTGESPIPELPPADPPHAPPDRKPVWTATREAGPLQSWSIDGQRVLVVNNPVFEILSNGAVGGWRLIPYVDRVVPEVLANFKRVAESHLDWDAGSFATKVADPFVRRDLVTRHRSKMARAYRYSFDNKNITSLSLYSGPANPTAAGAVQIYPPAEAAESAKVAWLGTGDSDLKDPGAISRFESHYRDVIGYVSTFLLPHHGSIHNSDPHRLVSNPDRWVAAADHPKWEHPACAVVAAVARHGRDFEHVNSAPGSILDEAIIVFWPLEL